MLLADGAELTEHQVDVLSGTLAALTTEIENSASDSHNGAGRSATELAGDDGTLGGTELEDNGDRSEAAEVAEEDETLAPDEEPQDWEEPATEMVAEAPEDPGASRRFWFEHATGSGKTVAALGFVEASRTGGVDPDPPSQPRRPVHRRGSPIAATRTASRRRSWTSRPPLRPSPSRPTSGSCATDRISDAYAIVICDEAPPRSGEDERLHPPLAGAGVHRMTATGALIARNVADLFPPRPRASTSPRPRGAA